MSKIRIHELAKELDKSNKEILSFLQDKKVDVKSHMSTLEDAHITMLKSAFGKNEKPAAVPKPAEPKEVKKSSNITQVYHPQNSQSNQRKPYQGSKPYNRKPAGQNAENMNNTGVTTNANQANASGKRDYGSSRTNERTGGYQGNRPVQAVGNQQSRPASTGGYQQNRVASTGGNQQNRTAPTGGNQQNRPQGAGRNQQNRPQGSRGYQGNRPASTGGTQGDKTQSTGEYQGNRQSSAGQSQGNRQTSSGSYQGSRQSSTGKSQGNRQASAEKSQGNRQASAGKSQGNRQAFAGQSQGNRQTSTGSYQGKRPAQMGQNQGNRSTGSYNNQNEYRSGQGGNRPSGTGSRTNQNANRPAGNTGRSSQNQNKSAQGGNRPNQGGGRRPNQGGNRPNQRNRYGNNRNNQPVQAASMEKEDVIKNIVLPEVMTIKELADKMKIQVSVLIKKLFLQGTMVTVNHEIDYETAEEIALEFNCIAEPEEVIDVIEELLKEGEEDEAKLVSRPPVVCVMGHVDHGKTSLLDAIRSTKVTNKEAGGITQHIGAYMVSINKQKITFLDTPGHEAFTSMRMRGANATDIAILVVAADDGVMPQTVEAISHAKAAGTEIIVAINKIDKPSANIERVKQELSEYELIPEDWGGSTIFVPVSAHTHEGIDQLLEMILLTAEIGELRADPDRKARGLVIEAKLDKGKGAVATVIVQKGTLHVGDSIAAGSCFGKVRAMMDDKGRRVKEAGPSVPVEILGLNDVPDAGEVFVSPETEKEARSFAETYISEGKAKLVSETKAKMSLTDLFSQIQAGNLKELGVIVKADVQGSVEAVKQSLLKLSNDEVIVKIIHGGVGAINESDVILASTSNAIIIGFNVRPDVTAKMTAENEGVDLRLYRVIYDAINDVESAMKGMLDPIFEEKVLGHAEVRRIFTASGVGTIAGSYVLDGIFKRGCSVRIRREDELIFEGALASLKRFKDDVKEVKSGYECGLVFEKFNDVKEGDLVEAYTMVEVPR